MDEKIDEVRQWGCGGLAFLAVIGLFGAALLISDSLAMDAVILLFMLGALVRVYLWMDIKRRQRHARARGFEVETGNQDEKEQ